MKMLTNHSQNTWNL